MIQKLQQEAVRETFEDVEKLINSISWRYYRKYGGELDDWISEGKLVYFKAYASHDPSKGARFGTWLYHKLISRFRNIIRYRMNRQIHTRQTEFGVLESAVAKQTFAEKFDKLQVLLSDEALTVLDLIFNMPTELQQAAEAKGGEPSNVRSCVRKYLKRNGWSSAEVRSVFSEIRCMF